MKKITAIFLIIFTALACCAKKEAMVDNGKTFSILKQSEHGGKETAGFEKVTDASSFKQLCTALNIENIPEADFSKSDVVAVYMGQRNTGGYSITIESMRVDGDTTYLKKKETKPEPGGMVSMALTAPYVIVAIPKTGKVVIE
ncbi:protease complex subunit PrcB family protein [Flavobacterium sp. RHBU_24]|uniref:protease complex subunit PrcB family protein n=1 Tax=Flavobacterium sp. RHBU_24 TaxID=3391185 RepID=UPI003984C10D